MRATTNENVDRILIAAISENIAVILEGIVHLTVILNTIWTAFVFVIQEYSFDCNLQSVNMTWSNA